MELKARKDYATRFDAKSGFLNGDEFIINDIKHVDNGKIVTIKDMRALILKKVLIRYGPHNMPTIGYTH